MKAIIGLLLLVLAQDVWATCREAGELCKPGVECCTDKGLVCTPRPGASSICVAGPVLPSTTLPPGVTTTTTTVKGTTTSTTVPASATDVEPVRPTYADVGNALLAGRGQFYVGYRGQVADQPIRDAMQQYVTGVILPELSRVLEADCSQVISWAYRGEGGALDVIYRRLGNVYEVLSSVWSIGPQGRNYSNDVAALEKFRDCLVGEPEKPYVTMGIRDALTLRIANGKYVRGANFFVFPLPAQKGQIANRAPVNVRLSFPPGADLPLLRAADSAHAAASGIGLFPLSVDAAAKAWESGPGCVNQSSIELKRSCLHSRMMKRFAGFCDPRWGAEGCKKWKLIQHHFFAQWAAASERGDWRDARNADSDHQLAHILTNYWNPDLDVRFSVPGVDEHDWPIMNGVTALATLGAKVAH